MMLLAGSPAGMPGQPNDRGCIAARVAVDYAAPVEFRPGLTLRVATSVAAVGTSSWTLHQRLYDGETLVARCECVLVGYDYAGAKSRPLDDDERAYWQRYA
jgi:acyl-CoA thioester hydrolase